MLGAAYVSTRAGVLRLLAGTAAFVAAGLLIIAQYR